MRRTTIALLIIVVVAACRTAAAQQPPPESGAWRSLAESLAPGTFIAVALRDGTTLKGTLVQRDADRMLVKPRTRIPVPVRALSYDDIESIEPTKAGSSPAMKVLIGVGTAFVVIGTLALIALASS